ncbi:integrase core domain-containing protein [Candidatus Palauibacter sp.]|uniref:integrase core domain-containing protein n=1 Tax=Candidatus Palauibacter sp. TaxID=3101350 RepID=UPI003B517CCE
MGESSSNTTGTPCSPATRGPASCCRRARGSPTRSAGPRDNPEMESLFGRFKVENRSLILDGSIEELAAVVRDRIGYYNRARRHSSPRRPATRRGNSSLSSGRFR